MEKVKKAVILAAGFGTRVLPASKAIPKEMLNIVDKPAIQYIVEEVINSGITEILIVLSRGKQEVEDHFDRKPDLEAQLLAGGKTEFYKVVCDIAEHHICPPADAERHRRRCYVCKAVCRKRSLRSYLRR